MGNRSRRREVLNLMARPPQYERDVEPWVDGEAIRAAAKRLRPEDRARLLAWLCLYYDDAGAMFSPQLTRRRKRVAIDGVEFWLVRVPKRRT